jgi:hypothetical protein
MKQVDRLQFKKAWNKNWELRDSKNGFPAFFPKSACYIINVFGWWDLTESSHGCIFCIFVLQGDVIVCYEADVRARCW